MIVLYSNDCPRCKLLEQRLKEKGIEYEKTDNFDYLISLNVSSVPMLKIDELTILPFELAMKYINKER